MKKSSLISFSSLAVLLLGSVLPAYADTTPPPSPVKTPQDVLNIMCMFTVYFFYAVIIITVIMVIWAAFLYITAGDDTEKTSKARRTLTYAAVGVAVSLCAVGFPSIIEGLAGSTSVGSLAPHCSILGGSSS
jgi:heme/copper-type cytochrome/quinol oxidase subunit 2